ncbi:MAG: hypothetical protein KJO29_10520, partial [Bacteroidia bacterium]|nr:hypothetical protein [Bacteroidia bacterium]
MIRNLSAFFILFLGSVHFLHSTESDLACSIDKLKVEALPCDSMNIFFAELSFEVDDPGVNGFLVRGNGVVYDTFEYGEVSYEIGPLSGDCSTIYQFTVEDIDDPDCEAYYEFDLPVCCTPPECKIQVDDVVQLACDSSGFRQIQFSIITENIGSLGFDIFFMGVPIAHFDYGFTNYVISLPGDAYFTLKIADTE